MGTEAPELLVEEYELAKQLVAKAAEAGIPAATAAEQIRARTLLERRDQFIAARIGDTLKTRETGVAFLGLLHSLAGKLADDIELISLLASRDV